MQKAFEDIVERLEEHLPPHSGWTKEVIEIVNQVAEEYEQEVCEWKATEYYLVGSCDGIKPMADVLAREFKYCPYCGKKIKVVE